MASFPTNAKSWVALVDRSDYPQVAQINEARDEISAIETGYLTGTARLNSSASTLASLSVSGGSTLAALVATNSTLSNLSVSSGSTLAFATVSSNLTVNGLIRSTGQTCCMVYSEVVQDLAHDTWTGVSWDAETFDVGGMHSTASNSSRLIVPTGASGTYLIHAGVRFGANSSESAAMRVRKNDTSDLSVTPLALNTGLGVGLTLLTFAVLDAGDYATVQVYQNSGSTESFGATGDRLQQPQCAAVRLF